MYSYLKQPNCNFFCGKQNRYDSGRIYTYINVNHCKLHLFNRLIETSITHHFFFKFKGRGMIEITDTCWVTLVDAQSSNHRKSIHLTLLYKKVLNFLSTCLIDYHLLRRKLLTTHLESACSTVRCYLALPVLCPVKLLENQRKPLDTKPRGVKSHLTC